MTALELAALRGVDVRIITTGKPDSWPVFLAAFHYMNELRDLGIRFYAYEPGFLHEKVSLIDDTVSTVGTPNFDNRSFRLNFEVTALIVDESFATEMEKMFEADLAPSSGPTEKNRSALAVRPSPLTSRFLPYSLRAHHPSQHLDTTLHTP